MTNEPTSSASANYLAYMLRFWREEANAPWRAAIQDPHTDEKHNFATPEQLWLFLQEKLDPPISDNPIP